MKDFPTWELTSKGNFTHFQPFRQSTCWKILCSLIISNPQGMSHGEVFISHVIAAQFVFSRSTVTD